MNLSETVEPLPELAVSDAHGLEVTAYVGNPYISLLDNHTLPSPNQYAQNVVSFRVGHDLHHDSSNDTFGFGPSALVISGLLLLVLANRRSRRNSQRL